MKRTALFLLSLFVITLSFGQKGQKPPVKDVEVIQFFNKTNVIIKTTFDLVKVNKVYTGGVAAAKDYQKTAIEDFKQSKNQQAINNSYIARRLTFRAYVANSGNSDVKNEWELNEHEKTLVTVNVTPEMLDEILAEYVEQEQNSDFNVDDLEDLDPSSADDNKGKQQSDGNNGTSKGKGKSN